jgi:hypothetical protein
LHLKIINVVSNPTLDGTRRDKVASRPTLPS